MPDPHSTKPLGAWLFPLLAAFLLAALFGTRLLNDADLGFHLKSGEWIVENHWAPSTDSFTATRSGQPYLDMEWLYQLFLYLGYRLGGYSLLTLGHTALALLAFFVLWVRLKGTGSPVGMMVPVFIVAVLASEDRFRVRPEVLSWVLLGLTLWILETRARGGKDRLGLLPVLQWVWINTEGLFFIGPAVMGIYLLSEWFDGKNKDPRLGRIFLFSLGACLLNPHLLKGLAFPLSFLSALGSSEVFKYMVREFQPPWTYVPAPFASVPGFLWAYKLFSLFLIGGIAVTFKQRRLRDELMAGFFFLFSVSAIRNIPLFMLACAPLAVQCWKDLPWPWLKKSSDRLLFKPLTAVALALFILGFCARVITSAHYVDNRLSDRFGWGLDPLAQPEEACTYLARNHIEGKVVNDLDSGDWLDWRGPVKPFIDGRLDVMGTEFFTEYARSQLEGGLGTLLIDHPADILLFNPLLTPQWMADLQARSDWRLVHLDGVAAVYLKKGFRDDLPTLDIHGLLSKEGIDPSLSTQTTTLLSAAQPPWGQRLWDDFTQPTTYPGKLMNLGIFCGYSGHPTEAELFLLEGIRRSQGRYFDFYYNLGLLYVYAGRREEAFLCMRRVLEERPREPTALKILGLP
jgi:hypothetical protein